MANRFIRVLIWFLQEEHQEAMQLTQQALLQSEHTSLRIPPAALEVRQVLSVLRAPWRERLHSLHRELTFSDVPTRRTVADVVNMAVEAFRQPPLSAALPTDMPVLLLKPQNRGWVYHSYGLPPARRWELAPVLDFGHLSLADALLRTSELSPGRFGRSNLREYIIHLGENLFVFLCTLTYWGSQLHSEQLLM